MNELAKTQLPHPLEVKMLPGHVLQGLPIEVKNVATAKATNYIIDFGMEGLRNKLAEIIGSAYQDLGQKADGKDLATLCHRLTNELYNTPWFHIGEFELALRNGIRGEYGDFFGINLASIMKFISEYRSSAEVKRYAHELSRLVGAKPEPNEQEKELIAQTLAIKTLNDRREGKDISLQSVTVYDYLDRKGMISFTKDEKVDFYNEAFITLHSNLSGKAAASKTKEENNAIKTQIETIVKLKNKELGSDDSANLLVKNEAKRLALAAYLDGMILEETELIFADN